jgi:hypothetical protein
MISVVVAAAGEVEEGPQRPRDRDLRSRTLR